MFIRLIDPILTVIVRGFIALIAVLPESIALKLCQAVVFSLLFLLPRFRRTGLRNLELVFPEKSEEERVGIFRRSLTVLARNLLMFAKIPTFQPHDFEAMFDYHEAHGILKDMREKAAGKGLMFLTLHFGSFEFLAQAQTVLDKPYAILARDFGLPMLDHFWKSRREFFGSRVFSRSGGFKEIVHCLSSGENVAVLFDQNVKTNHAAFVPLFGIPAATTKAVAIASLRSGAPTVVCCCVEIAPWRFRMLAEQIPNPVEYPGASDEKILAFLTRAHQSIERFVSEYPEQWYWVHRRFKTRPEGEQETLYSDRASAAK